MSPQFNVTSGPGLWHRRVFVTVAVLALTVIGAGLFGAHKWIVDRYYLFRVGRASPEEQWEYVGILVKRKCVEVTPYLLKVYSDNPFSGTIGITTWEHSDRLGILVSLGPASVPYLAEAIGAKECEQRLLFEALGSFGPQALPALPALIGYLHTEPQTKRLIAAMNAIGCIGGAAKSAVPALLTFQRDERKRVRWQLYVTLRGLGPSAQAAVPLLLDAVEFEQRENLSYAAYALAIVDPGRPDGISLLVKCLKDESWFAREFAAEFLGELGDRARQSVPTLLEVMTQDSKAFVVEAAEEALDKIGGKQGLSTYLRRVFRGATESRHAAVVALAGSGARASVVVPALVRATGDPNQIIAQAAVEALISMLDESESRSYRIAAIKALAQIGPAAIDAIPSLRRIAEDASGETLAAYAREALRIIRE